MVILESSQIKEWDLFTLTSQNISSFELMQRAAAACVDWIRFNLNSEDKFAVFCGKGNNGGDGLLVAKSLADLGHEVDIYIVEFGKKGTDDFQKALQLAHEYSLKLHFISSEESIPKLTSNLCIIDALYGIGLNRSLDVLSERIVHAINKSNATIVSIDLPSGMFADLTNENQKAIQSSHTLSFGCYKLSFLHASAEPFLGHLHILDIGLDASFLNAIALKFQFIDETLIRGIYKPRSSFSHKGHYGHALLIAGSVTMLGAAVIAANACVRTGAGKTDWWSPLTDHPPIGLLPEIMLPAYPIHDHNRYTAVAMGPGFGMNESSETLVENILKLKWNRMLIDADGLNLISKKPELLKTLMPDTILTPHPKEFERLLDTDELEQTPPWNKLQRFAKRIQCVVVLKGKYTMIASPEGLLYVNRTGNPGLAKGGSGDALTGIILGLLAQTQYQPLEAAILGVFLHGRAADLALERQSEESLIASDLADYLGLAFKGIN